MDSFFNFLVKPETNLASTKDEGEELQIIANTNTPASTQNEGEELKSFTNTNTPASTHLAHEELKKAKSRTQKNISIPLNIFNSLVLLAEKKNIKVTTLIVHILFNYIEENK